MKPLRKTLIVIPARGGSRGIPKKNLQKIGDLSLVARAIKFSLELPGDFTVFVSTDCEETAKEAITFSAECPVLRPKEISGDTSSDMELLQHAVNYYSNIEKKNFDFIMMLQPTSPMRLISDVEACWEYVSKDFDAAWTLSPLCKSHHPFKQLKLNSGELAYFSPEGAETSDRQSLEQTFIRNGACYLWKREALIRDGDFLPKNSAAVILERVVIDIDSQADLDQVRTLLEK